MDGVSVVIPCYNAAKYLSETLTSVLSQDYPGPLEVLVADDDSSDGSRVIAESFGAPVRVLPKPPESKRGAAVARNRCIQAATQPLVAFLDADDLYMPGHLNALAEVMSARPELGLVYDRGYDVDSNGEILRPRFSEPHEPRTTPDKLLLEQCFGTGEVMVRRSVFDRVGLFDESLRHSEDHDMWLRIVEAFPAAYVPFGGFMYRQHAKQATKNLALWHQGERVLGSAVARYPYSRTAVRKRRAVLAYRMALAAQQAHRPAVATMLFAKAGVLDPFRAIQEMGRWAATTSRRAMRSMWQLSRRPTVFS